MTMEIKEYLPYLIDIVCIAVLTGFFIYGWQQGFASRVMKLCSTLLALVITFFTYNILAQMLNAMGLTRFVMARVKVVNAALENATAERFIQSLNLPTMIKEMLLENNVKEMYALLGVENVREYVRAFLARSIVNAIAACIMFFLSLVFLNYLAGKLKKMNELPVLGLLNQILGGIGGVLLGILIVAFPLLLIIFLASPTNFLGTIAEGIEQSQSMVILKVISKWIGWLARIR